MLSRVEIFNRLKSKLNISEEIVEETFLDYKEGTGLNMTSLDLVGLIVQVEEEFNIVVDYYINFETLKDIVDYVEKEISKERV